MTNTTLNGLIDAIAQLTKVLIDIIADLFRSSNENYSFAMV